MHRRGSWLFVSGWLSVFFVFCVLGNWQLSRYHFKRRLLATAEASLTAQPVSFARVQRGQMAASPFLRLKLRGYYQNDATLFVQNQFYHHQVGVLVLTPVQLPGDKKWLLVDRGWHSLQSIQTMPVIQPVTGLQNVSGYIRPKAEFQFILGPVVLNPLKRPLVIQKMDLAEISRTLKVDFYPFVLKLDPDAANGFVRERMMSAWVSVPPERHLGYAIQWFLMAFVLLIACVFWTRKRGGICRVKK